jgi:hypothetical protein
MDTQTSNTNTPPAYVQERDRSRVWLWALIGLLIASNAVTIYMLTNKNTKIEQQTVQLESTNKDLSATKVKLDSISRELDVRIEEVKKLGGDVTSLENIKAQLEKDKVALLADKRASGVKIEDFQNRIRSYEAMLNKKDEELKKLKGVNQELLSENTGLKEKQNSLSDSISNIEKERQQLAEKVNIAAALKAENLAVNALNDRGKERDGGEYKARQVEKIKVIFSLAENKLARIEGKNIYMRLIEPDGSVPADVNSGGGTFNFEGRELSYTAKQDILFDNTRQRIAFVWSKGSPYKSGKHGVELYADGFKIGQGSFEIK